MPWCGRSGRFLTIVTQTPEHPLIVTVFRAVQVIDTRADTVFIADRRTAQPWAIDSLQSASLLARFFGFRVGRQTFARDFRAVGFYPTLSGLRAGEPAHGT